MSDRKSKTGQQGQVQQFGSLEEERESLERRLSEGYSRIEEALAAGQDVSSWERFWIELLHRYEIICNQLRQAA
jgi:hypothetical protein